MRAMEKGMREIEGRTRRDIRELREDLTTKIEHVGAEGYNSRMSLPIIPSTPRIPFSIARMSVLIPPRYKIF
jgi:hypothetical protein